MSILNSINLRAVFKKRCTFFSIYSEKVLVDKLAKMNSFNDNFFPQECLESQYIRIPYSSLICFSNFRPFDYRKRNTMFGVQLQQRFENIWIVSTILLIN